MKSFQTTTPQLDILTGIKKLRRANFPAKLLFCTNEFCLWWRVTQKTIDAIKPSNVKP